MNIIHPECDIREWLKKNSNGIAPYTLKRIGESYGHIPRLLQRCGPLADGFAYDIGCGSGFDTFALGQYFKHVVGIDVCRKAIKEARQMAGGAGVSNISFEHKHVEHYSAEVKFDFIFCNFMSHNLPSRISLMKHISDSLRVGGFLLYSEISEGYAPMEIHRAILQGNKDELITRCWQILNGFTGRKGFRFFLSGTVKLLAETCGLQVLDIETQRWNGLPYSEMVVCRKRGNAEAPESSDADYLEVDKSFKEARDSFINILASHRIYRLTGEECREIQGQVLNSKNLYMSFLLYLLMSDIARITLVAGDSFAGQLWNALIRRVYLLQRNIDWDGAKELDRIFMENVKSKHGPDG